MRSLKLILIYRKWSIYSIYNTRSKPQFWIILSAQIQLTVLKLALTQNIQESRGITCPLPVSSLTRVRTCLISMWRWTYQQLANIIIHLIETWTKLSAFARVRLSDGDLCHFERCPVFEPLHRWSRISRNVASQCHGCVLVHCLIRKTENRWRKNLCQEKENLLETQSDQDLILRSLKSHDSDGNENVRIKKKKSKKNRFTMWNQTTRKYSFSFKT